MSTVFSRKRPVLRRMIKIRSKNVSVKAGVFVWNQMGKLRRTLIWSKKKKFLKKLALTY